MPDADTTEPEGNQPANLEGEFWLASNPRLLAPGTLHVDPGLLELQRELVLCTTREQLDDQLIRLRPVADLDTKYRLLGRTSDGTLITIPVATRGQCEHKVEPETQEFHVLQWLTGGHLELRL